MRFSLYLLTVTKATTERVASQHARARMLPLPLLLVRDLGGLYLCDRDLEYGLEKTTKESRISSTWMSKKQKHHASCSIPAATKPIPD